MVCANQEKQTGHMLIHYKGIHEEMLVRTSSYAPLNSPAPLTFPRKMKSEHDPT
jgi:hypothetical protein